MKTVRHTFVHDVQSMTVVAKFYATTPARVTRETRVPLPSYSQGGNLDRLSDFAAMLVLQRVLASHLWTRLNVNCIARA